MKNKKGITISSSGHKAILWVVIAVYTFLLPFFIFIYRPIFYSFGLEFVGKIPLVIVALFGIMYVAAVLRRRKDVRYLLFLIPCAIITYLIMRYEANPNKHIHIPEYVLMAWLLFAVLSRDHKGKGIFILIFLYGSLLGVVDELQQGIHPSRFYGWSDMLVNSASTIIGIFTILGVVKVKEGSWDWVRSLKEFKELVFLNLFGLAGAAVMCVRLFEVQAGEKFWGIYPRWLWAWSLLFVITALLAAIAHLVKYKRNRQSSVAEGGVKAEPGVAVARLWIFPLLVILFYMHAMLVFISAAGISFE